MEMIELVINKRRKTFGLVSAIVSAVLISAACTGTTGPEAITPQGPPWAPVDSAWKVIENLRYAYITMDVELYMSCFRDDFEFWSLYMQQDTCWGYEFEELCHQNMFNYAEIIELQFWGDAEYPWSGDSTGQSLALIRQFDLKVYLNPYSGYRGSGNAFFICKPDSSGEWYIWKWYDQSDTREATTWGTIKEQFS
jgi:hypothetical protein